ncbi:MAG TPA: hypothetical protein VG168_12130 [Bryobacteraceae bacterium]|nr:hypothetical protein [Bryobacteraceae bacterium]
MKTILLSLLVAAAPLVGQSADVQSGTTHPLASPRRAATSSTGNSPAILGAQLFSILPHVVDGVGGGSGWTTQVVITNTGTGVESWEVDFYSDSNQAMSFNFTGVGLVSYLAGALNPGQSVTYTTNGQTNGGAITDGWGALNPSSGGSISIYQVLVDSLPQFLFASSSSTLSTYGIGGDSTQPGAVIPFDNTNGFIDGLAFTNPDSTNQNPSGDTINVTVYDSNYSQLGTHQVTVAPGNKVLVVMPTAWTETANQKGSLYIFPQGSNFSPITPLALRFQYLGAAQSFTTLPVLQYY